MKILLPRTLGIVLAMGLTGVVGAANIYDNWMGTFGLVDTGGHPHAEGNVVINYVEGESLYRVHVSLIGLIPDQEYIVHFQGGPDEIETVLGRFVADAIGNGTLNVKGFSTDEIDLRGGLDEYEWRNRKKQQEKD